MKFWSSVFAIFIISIITFAVWKGVLNQALIGEGPTYFVEPYVSMVEQGGFKELWGRHDVQALLFFHTARDVFRDNMRLYMAVLLIGSGFVSFTVYLLVKKITGSFLFGIIASILLTSNFVGSFEILGLGYYQWFIQRVPNFGMAILGIICLLRYLEKKDIKNYFLSLFLYLLSVYLARYTIHILPLFLLLILSFEFSKRMRINKVFLKNSLLAATPFLIGSYVLIKAQSLVDGGSFFDFIKNFDVVPNVFYQVSYLTIPFLSALPKYFFPGIVGFIAPVVMILYIVALIYSVRKNKKLFPFLISVFISIFASVYLSIFLNPYFINYYDTSRYLYYTSILISIFWGVVLYQISKNNKILRILIVLFTIIWFFYNKGLIAKSFEYWQERHDPVVATIDYMTQNFNNFPDNSNVVVPKELSYYASGMLGYFYREKGFKFYPDLDYEAKPKNFIHLTYDVGLKTINEERH